MDFYGNSHMTNEELRTFSVRARENQFSILVKGFLQTISGVCLIILFAIYAYLQSTFCYSIMLQSLSLYDVADSIEHLMQQLND